jgi:hypothetical protein
MPKAARNVIDTMRKNYLTARFGSTPINARKPNVQAAFFTKAEIQAFLNQLVTGEDVMVHLISLSNGHISLAMVGHTSGRDMSINTATGALKDGSGIPTAAEGIYSIDPCPPSCKDTNKIFIVN